MYSVRFIQFQRSRWKSHWFERFKGTWITDLNSLYLLGTSIPDIGISQIIIKNNTDQYLLQFSHRKLLNSATIFTSFDSVAIYKNVKSINLYWHMNTSCCHSGLLGRVMFRITRLSWAANLFTSTPSLVNIAPEIMWKKSVNEIHF